MAADEFDSFFLSVLKRRIATVPLRPTLASSLEDGQVAVVELQNNQVDRRDVDRADVAGPSSATLLLLDNASVELVTES